LAVVASADFLEGIFLTLHTLGWQDFALANYFIIIENPFAPQFLLQQD